MIPNEKKDFQNMLFQILNPIRSRYSEGKALVQINGAGVKYDERCMQMEGFTRSLWGLAPYFCGNGVDAEFHNNIVLGLEHGTDPEHEEYWGGFQNSDQRFCEMAALSLGLLLIPEQIWDPLSQQAKNNVMAWMSNINKFDIPQNNWQFFRIFVNSVFKKLGGPYDEEAIQAAFETIESFYLGDGWYKDGKLGSKDYYISFAFHFYGLIYSVVMKEEEPERCTIYRKRADQFATDFIYWFDDNGEAVPYGRSLTYRFAEAAFFSACVFAGIEPIPMPVMKGILARHLAGWMETPIFDNGGILTVGYKYPNLIMAENYNAPGSPMWSLKVFLMLALADSHPFWSVEPAPMPVLDKVKILDKAEKIMCRDSNSVTMYPCGSRIVPNILGHMTEKTGKFAYSTKYGFSVQKSAESLENFAPDSTLVFQIHHAFFTRGAVTSSQITDGVITSEWSPIPGIKVTSTITPEPNGHTRRHVIQSEYECKAFDCGFALPTAAKDYTTSFDGESAVIRSGKGHCRVSGGEGLIIAATPNSNLMYTRTAIPAVSTEIKAGETIIETHVDFA